MSGSPCIASRDDGTLCRAPASILDHQRGGLVCLQHVPEDVAEEMPACTGHLNPRTQQVEVRCR